MLSIKPENIIFKNDLISIVYNDTRVDLLDSDGKFIDYFYDCLFYDEKEQNEMMQSIINDITGLNETNLCKWIDNTFDSIFKIEPFCGDEQTINELREKWGDEYVNRIGNTALIIKE